jgi:hypothetical protein
MSSIARKRALRESADRRIAEGKWGAMSSADFEDDIDQSAIPGSIDGVPG